jgi:hypothetical protein
MENNDSNVGDGYANCRTRRSLDLDPSIGASEVLVNGLINKRSKFKALSQYD